MNRPRKASQPMTPSSYRAVSKRLHEMADDLALCGSKPEPKVEAIIVIAGIMGYLNQVVRRLKI